MKFILLAFLSIMFLFPLYTSAKTITNLNGVEMTEEEYNNFLKVYTEEYILTMTQDRYEKIKDYNYNEVKTVTKYIETTYNSHLGLTTEREMTKEEYENFDSSIMPILDDKGTSLETTAKQFTLNFVDGGMYDHVITTATWKGIPSTRSFDVIGFRGEDFEFINGSQYGEQVYKENGTYKSITYSWNGGNTKRFSNGYGTSMNLINATITYLQATTECDVNPTTTYPVIFSSYQHAMSDLTLEKSQDYTISRGGLGSVFYYPYEISAIYDGMAGLSLSF